MPTYFDPNLLQDDITPAVMEAEAGQADTLLALAEAGKADVLRILKEFGPGQLDPEQIAPNPNAFFEQRPTQTNPENDDITPAVMAAEAGQADTLRALSEYGLG